jgi:hypothetical protein
MSPMMVIWSYQVYEMLFNHWKGKSMAYITFIMELSEFTIDMTSINYSINFIIYTISLDFYREEVKNILRCGRELVGTG